MSSKLIITILGEPGSGKGTQAERIAKNFNDAHIETGGLIRKFIQTDPQAKARYMQGKLQPNAIVAELVEKEIVKLKNKRFILDPFPLNLEQIDFLSLMVKKYQLSKPVIIYLKVDKKIALKRILARTDKRKDDSLDIAVKRIDQYSKNLKKIISSIDCHFYIIRINGNPSRLKVEQEITKKLLKIIRENKIY